MTDVLVGAGYGIAVARIAGPGAEGAADDGESPASTSTQSLIEPAQPVFQHVVSKAWCRRLWEGTMLPRLKVTMVHWRNGRRRIRNSGSMKRYVAHLPSVSGRVTGPSFLSGEDRSGTSMPS